MPKISYHRHGLHDRPEYGAWHQMKSRCETPSNKAFKNYGARGITLCERWHDFAAFFADMGPRPTPEHSIERVNNNGPYSPDNCKWGTKLEQGRNKRTTVFLTLGEVTRTLTEWCEVTGIKDATLRRRLVRGWSEERTLTTSPKPVRAIPDLLVTLNGETRRTSEWAKTTGVNRKFLIRRLRHGWTQEKALTAPRRMLAHVFTIDGISKTLPEWGRHSGINLGALHRRLRLGWTIEKSLSTPLGPARRRGGK